MTAYFSLIESHMSYGLLGWGHAPQAKRIFALQRRVIRIIYGAGYRDDIRHTFAELGVLTLPCLYIMQCLLLIWNVNHAYHKDCRGYFTRQGELINIEYLRLKSSRTSFNYFSKRLYNKLPLASRTLPVHLLKQRLKKWLIKHSYYSLDEFFMADLPPDMLST